MIDRTRSARNRMVVDRLDPSLPLGLHPPKREGDCGWDLAAMQDIVIPPMQAVDVPVNARVQLPPNAWGMMLARSSIAKRNLDVLAGVIDNGYRGPLYVVLRNMRMPTLLGSRSGRLVKPREPEYDDGCVTIKAGERVAQLVLYHLRPAWVEEGDVDMATDRGTAGFGSTGL